MHRSTHLAVTILIAAMPALVTPLASAQSTGTSRAEVKAETQKARKAGAIAVGEQGPKEAPFKAGMTRLERKAQTKDAVAKGEVTSRGEASPPEAEARVAKGSGKPRAEVKAEVRTANKAGALRVGESYPERAR